MLDIVHEWGSWLALVATALGIVATMTIGTRIGRPALVATAWATVALAGGMLGMALGLRKVDTAFRTMASLELGVRVKILSVGTREASDSLLVGGACALLLVTVGAVMAARAHRSSGG